MNLLESVKFKCSVSSVLNKDVKQNGKQFMFDQMFDTAWSSNEGTPQWICIQFDEPQELTEFSYQFQGGFVGKNATVRIESADGHTLCEEPFYPEDVNSVQSFILNKPVRTKEAIKIKFVFGASTDFFGRIIVYTLKIF